MKIKDAWKQKYDLYRKFTKTWYVRQDLRVRALATERCVEFGLGEYKDRAKFGSWGYEFAKDNVTQRNVSTMRELALTLWAACDFVDASNPTWASHGGTLGSVESFEEKD